MILWLSRRARPWLRVGDLLPIVVIWIGAARFLLEFLRIGNWRLADIPTAQIFGVGFVIVGIAVLVIRHRQDAPILEPGRRRQAHDMATMTRRARRRPAKPGDDDDFKDFDEAIRARS